MQVTENEKAAKTQKDTGQAGLSRRSFLAATGVAAAMFGLGEAGRAMKSPELLRPPGAQDEATFLSKCLRCDRCRSVCPTSVIGMAHVEDGILNARTPLMKFHLGYCTFCKKCVDVCPTEALLPFDVKRVKIGVAKVTDHCIAWGAGGCVVCHRDCPYHAIALDEHKRPVVDSAKCNGCGLCEKVCPALVLRSYIGGTVRGIEVVPVSGGGLL
jgi:ferredoxin-type protein NapG